MQKRPLRNDKNRVAEKKQQKLSVCTYGWQASADEEWGTEADAARATKVVLTSSSSSGRAAAQKALREKRQRWRGGGRRESLSFAAKRKVTMPTEVIKESSQQSAERRGNVIDSGLMRSVRRTLSRAREANH